MCSLVGVIGNKTNHLLRTMAATWLLQRAIDNQLIMGATGHHSTDGIRVVESAPSSVDLAPTMAAPLSR